MSQTSKRHLEAYLDRFEADGEGLLLEHAPHLTRWIRYPHTYDRPKTVSMRLTGGERVRGPVLHAAPDRLLLLPAGTSDYSWRHPDALRTVPVAALQSFRTPVFSLRPVLVGAASGVVAGLAAYALADDGGHGLALGADTTVLALVSSTLDARRALVRGAPLRYAAFRPDLREASAFEQMLPPELRYALETPLPSAPPPKRGSPVAWLLGRPERYLHGFASTPRTSYAEKMPSGTVQYLSFGDQTGYQTVTVTGVQPASQLVLSGSITPVRGLGIGGEWATFAAGGSPSVSRRTYESREVYGFAELHLRAPAEIPLLHRVSASVAYGRGRASHTSETETPINPSWYFYTLQPVPSITSHLRTTHEFPATLLRVGFDFWISPYTSIRSEYTRKTIDGRMEVPGYDYQYSSNGNTGLLAKATPYSVNLSHSDVSIGLRLHF